MRVLVLESDQGAADDAGRRLEAAGHEVHRCSDRGDHTFPCKGVLEGEVCPLDSGPVDVVLVVRAHPWPRPTPRELGVTCALRAHVPVVVAGTVALSPYEEYATVSVEGDEVVSACEEAAAAPLARHARVAGAKLREVLGRMGQDAAGAGAVVVRREGRLVVTLRTLEPLDLPTRRAAVVHVLGALRGLAPSARGLDVVFEAGAPAAGARR